MERYGGFLPTYRNLPDCPGGFRPPPPANHYYGPMRRRSRSFGSESDWNEYRHARYEGSPYHSFSTEYLHDNSLQEYPRTPKYISSVSVKVDSFAINTVQVLGHMRSPFRYYSEPAPCQQLQGIGHLNPAYASDTDSDVGRSRKQTYFYLPDRSPVFLPHNENKRNFHDENIEEHSHDKWEHQGHVNAAYMQDEIQRRSSTQSDVSYRRPSKNRISPDMMEMVNTKIHFLQISR